MDFNKVLSMATHNKQYSSYVTPAKRYSTELPAPKKPPKSNVQSDAVKAFLAKKKQEEEMKAREFVRKKQDLLELRSIAKHNRKATAMAKRTKDNNFMANFSFMEELMKNGGDPSSLASLLPSGYQHYQSDDRVTSSATRKSSENPGRSPPYRGASNGNCGANINRPRSNLPAPSHKNKSDSGYRPENPGRNSASMADRKGVPSRRPPPAAQNSLNFHDLLKLAARKQHEPVEVLTPKKVAKDVDFQGRLMTNDDKRRFIEEQTRKQGRSLAEVTLPPTSRRRKKFRRDADEGDELVASNLSPCKVPQSAISQCRPSPGAKRGPGQPKVGEPARQQDARPAENSLTRVRVPDDRGRPLMPKQGISNGHRPTNPPTHKQRAAPSASKQNHTPKGNAAPGNRAAQDERTREPARLPCRGQPNGKCAQPAKLPSQRLPLNRDPAPGRTGATGLPKLRDPAVLRQPQNCDPASGRPVPPKLRDPAALRHMPQHNGLNQRGPSRDIVPNHLPQKALNRKVLLPSKGQAAKPLPPRALQPKQFPPRDHLPKQFPPRDPLPKQYPPRDLLPKQFPPRDLMPREFPPRDVRRPLQRPVKRRIESDEEYDEEMDDFIDDGPIDGENMDVSEHIKEIFGYDRNKYRYEPEDDLEIMESSFAQQMREEAISTKMGILEDLEDIRREQEELKGKYTKKKRK